MLHVIVVGLLMAFPVLFLAVVGIGMVLLLLPYILILVSIVGLNIASPGADGPLFTVGLIGSVWSLIRHRKLVLEFCRDLWEFVSWLGSGFVGAGADLVLGLKRLWMWWIKRTKDNA